MKFTARLAVALAAALFSVAPASAQLLRTQTLNVDTYAKLQGVAYQRLTDGDGAVVVGKGGGEFVWVSGNQSANIIANNTTCGIWLAPTAASSGASGAWKRVKSDPVEAAWCGAIPDDAADDKAAIQAALDVQATRGKGVVNLDGGVFDLSAKLTIDNLVILRGQGSLKTTLKLANGANDSAIQSVNFASLTGTNTWLVGSGMKHGFGIERMSINGNKANQTAGDCVKLYGKRYTIDDVIIYDCYGVGFYSEGAAIPGQTDQTDLPEASITNLRVRKSGSHGIQWRGPHDARIYSAFVNENVGKGIYLQSDGATYESSSDWDFIHAYANTDNDVHIEGGGSRFGQIIAESGYKECLIIDSWNNQIGKLQAYNCDRTSGTYAVIINGDLNTIDNVNLRAGGSTRAGLSITGKKNTINGGLIDGEGTAIGNGLDVSSNWNKVRLHVEDFDQAGAICFRDGGSSAINQGQFDLGLNNCATSWHTVNGSTATRYNIFGFNGVAGQVERSGAALSSTDVANVIIYDADTTAWVNYGNVPRTGEYVDVANSQTITGAKTFTGVPILGATGPNLLTITRAGLDSNSLSQNGGSGEELRINIDADNNVASSSFSVYLDGSEKLQVTATAVQIQGGAYIQSAAGAPAGGCTTGNIYMRTDGGTNTTLYVCESSAWVAK